MKSIRRFFCATPRDANMQTLTVEEIAKRMQKTDNEQALRLPRAFASAVSDILNAEDTAATTNKHLHPHSGR